MSVDMKSALHQVKTFCGDRLSGIERRRYEEQRAKELGGKVGLPYMEVKSSEGEINIGMLGRLTDIRVERAAGDTSFVIVFSVG